MRQLPKPTTDRRTLNRYQVAMPVTLREGRACDFAVTILDISCQGCRLDLGYYAVPGQVVTLRFAGLQPMRATIMWSADRQSGLKFASAFHYSVLRHLMAMIGQPLATIAEPVDDPQFV